MFVGFNSTPLRYAHHLFLNGKEVKELSIPNSVTSIGSGAFEGCSALTSVTIGNSVKSIGNRAFGGCYGLKDVYCYAENPPSIISTTFEEIPSDATLHVPAASVERYREGEYWSGFFKQIVAL